MTNSIHLTANGHNDIIMELEELKEQRPQLVTDMENMRSLGDLKENAAYEEAKRKLAFLDGRIQELEDILRKATILEKTPGDEVALGSTVTLHVEGYDVTYQIVNEAESDIMNNKISANSPIGEALLGKKIHDIFAVESPSGKIHYRVLHID